MCKVTPNTYYSALDLKGPDASKTLQGQLTNDVETLRDHAGLTGLLCNLKGRIELVVMVYKHAPEHLTLMVPSTNIDALKRRLAPYVAFSKSRLSERDLSGFSLVYPPPSLEPSDDSASLWFDGLAVLSPEDAVGLGQILTPSDISEYHSYRIESGRVQLTPEQSDLYTPQSLSLDRLGYVSFKKGCYMGQEIIARLHYKGQSKYQLALLQCEPGVKADSKVMSHAGTPLGTIVDVEAGEFGFYLASLRTATESQPEYFVNDRPANVLKLFSN